MELASRLAEPRMIEVNCPACQKPMGVEIDQPNVEWECPTCETAFRAQPRQDGTMQLDVISAGTHAIQPESLNLTKRKSRRRRKRAELDEGERDRDLNISLSPALSFQDRFPDLQPGQPPSLFTFNGIGTMMYGSRDFDEMTGTYVTSACFTVFFVPIFVIGSYRVADAPAEGWLSTGGWHVLGKVP